MSDRQLSLSRFEMGAYFSHSWFTVSFDVFGCRSKNRPSNASALHFASRATACSFVGTGRA